VAIRKFRFASRVLVAALFSLAVTQAPANAAAPPDPVPDEGLIVQESTGALMTPDHQASNADQYVQIWRRDPGGNYSGSQYWDIDRVGNDRYTIRNVAINRCLQTKNADTKVNTPLWLTACNGQREQQWYIVHDHGYRYALVPVRNRNVVVGSRGTGRDEYVVLSERWSSADRLWTFKSTANDNKSPNGSASPQ